MGCDLHAIICAEWCNEMRPMLAFWEPRDYSLFAAMANVRNYREPPIEPVAEPRGLPSYIRLVDDSMVTGTMFGNEDFWIGDHSYSWLTPDEFAEAIRRAGGVDAEYTSALAAMRAYEAEGRRVELVFGFDN